MKTRLDMRYDCSVEHNDWTISLIVDEEEVFACFGKAKRVKVGWASTLTLSRRIVKTTDDLQNACRAAQY